MINDDIKLAREQFMPIAIMDHHISKLVNHSTYDLYDRLSTVWNDVGRWPAESSNEFIMKINNRIASSLGGTGGEFLDPLDWEQFVEECDDFDEDPEHIGAWHFSALYWKHLTSYKLSTCWIYINMLRIKHDLPTYSLSESKVGAFMRSLSASGPPIYDGQTFYVGNFSN